MTAYTNGSGSSAPPSVNRVEELLAWSAMVLAYVNPGLKYTVNSNPLPGEDGKAAACTYEVRDLPQGGKYLYVTAFIPMDENYLNDRSRKFWTFVNDLSLTPIPAGFTTD